VGRKGWGEDRKEQRPGGVPCHQVSSTNIIPPYQLTPPPPPHCLGQCGGGSPHPSPPSCTAGLHSTPKTEPQRLGFRFLTQPHPTSCWQTCSPCLAAAILFARPRHLLTLPHAAVLHGTAKTELWPLGFRLLATTPPPACHWQTRHHHRHLICLHAPPLCHLCALPHATILHGTPETRV
jgi:hypothetical protein